MNTDLLGDALDLLKGRILEVILADVPGMNRVTIARLPTRDVLARIPTHPQKDIAALTPAGWAATREEAVAAQQ
ncbi:hypothetical protein JYT15_00710 [Acidimicrobium ferrooxidans]|nr:hypothetical protein [Acidimicrobium ferrooxidans]